MNGGGKWVIAEGGNCWMRKEEVKWKWQKMVKGKEDDKENGK